MDYIKDSVDVIIKKNSHLLWASLQERKSADVESLGNFFFFRKFKYFNLKLKNPPAVSAIIPSLILLMIYENKIEQVL